MATEDRWHDFAKEKPSEDMEGRDFIVSNGYSDTLSMWCGGYWENEPFMGNKLCDEVVRWKGYLTPEEEKANEATRTELKADKTFVFGEECEAYKKSDVDELLAEKDAEIAELKKKLMPCLNGDCILTCEVVEKYGKENAELKAENERLKKCEIWMKQHFYCEEVIACESAKNRRLKRALWLARAERALTEAERYRTLEVGLKMFRGDYETAKEYSNLATKWDNVEQLCKSKAKEYK